MIDKHIDDCPICQAQRRAEAEGRMMTLQEYVEACSDERERQAVEVLSNGFKTAN
jgi:hypothetical protein